MYVLEIETKNHLRKIINPRKAVAKDLVIRSIVKVMDGDGKWHFIGHGFHPSDATWAADDINYAISQHKDKVVVDTIS